MISAVVIAKNEERNIKRCLLSLKWCDEVILIDDYSTDRTSEMAKKFGAHIFKRQLNGDFAGQLNFGLGKTQGEWVLFVHADEEVSSKLRDEIKTKTREADSSISGFLIKKEDHWLGRTLKHGENGNVKLVRLGRKGSGQWRRKIHEIWEVKGEVGELANPIRHFKNETIAEFVEKLNFYSTLHARENMQEGKKKRFWKIIVYPVAKFCVNYVVKLGFLDGTAGFVMAVMMSFHSFLSWSK